MAAFNPLRYVPYHELDGAPNVIVDGSAAEGTVLTLSHWPKSPIPPGLERDLSAQMAIAYLDRGDLHGAAQAVSNNHFDQDGLVSVFALAHPDEAASRRRFLIDVAAAGDFATYRNRDAARVSMIIAAFADPDRSPLGAGDASNYAAQVALLYHEMLTRLPDLCDNPADWRELWEAEDATLTASEEAVRNGTVVIEENEQLDLAIIRVPESSPSAGGHRFGGRWDTGLHPMAVNNATDRFVILTIRGCDYELLYRYETWVQYWSRRPRPRVDLSPLAERLTSEERGDAHWVFEGVDSLAPRLYLADDAESTLSPDEFQRAVEQELATGEPAWIPFIQQA